MKKAVDRIFRHRKPEVVANDIIRTAEGGLSVFGSAAAIEYTKKMQHASNFYISNLRHSYLNDMDPVTLLRQRKDEPSSIDVDDERSIKELSVILSLKWILRNLKIWFLTLIFLNSCAIIIYWTSSLPTRSQPVKIS